MSNNMAASTLTLSVPAEKIGFVIGIGGAGLRRIGQETGVKVQVPREVSATGERTIEMVGMPEGLQRAQQIVIELMEGKGAQNKRKLPMDFLPGTYSRPVQQCFYATPTGGMMSHAPPGLPGSYMAQQQPHPMIHGSMNEIGGTFEVKIIIDTDKVGAIVGKAGAGLKQLRETSGCTFTLTRDMVLGGRLLVINPPVDAQQRCIAYVCERLAGMGGMTDNPTADVSLKLLVPTNGAGVIIGKGGAGFRELRALGVAVEMAREEVSVAERMLSVTGPALAVSAAVNTVVAKLASN